MLLLQLPPETLIQIFDHVGSPFFRADISRLTICKQWSEFAYNTCFRDFHATQTALRFLMSSPNVESNLSSLRNRVETLGLDLKGFNNWDIIPTNDLWTNGQGHALRVAWVAELNEDLLQLAVAIKRSQKLRTLNIETTSEIFPLPELLPGLLPQLLPERQDYLYLTTIRAFLNISNLTNLKLDLCGTLLQNEDGEESHFCTVLAELLTTLQCLWLRMRCICADVLNPQEHPADLRLNKLLINLSLSNESPLTTSMTHARHCGSSAESSFLELKANMEEQARTLVTHMTAPKMVRILTHRLPRIQLQAFDVLSGKNFMLDIDAEWDDAGEAVEDKLFDEESEISSLSSDND